MAWSPKRKALTFSFALLLVSTAFVVSAAASTSGVLAPFHQGSDYPKERGLSRGHTVALGVVVSAIRGDDPVRVAGATVTVIRMAAEAGGLPDQAGRGEAVAQQTTDDKGRAIFELKPGRYVVNVAWNTYQGSQPVPVPRDMRLGVIFDEEGQAHWNAAPHRDLERRGDLASLFVRTGDNASGHPQPIGGVTVNVYALDENRQVGELVASKTTNERGVAVFPLHKGGYRVVAQRGDSSGSIDVPLRQDVHLGFLFEPDGTVTVHKFDPPHKARDQPPRDRSRPGHLPPEGDGDGMRDPKPGP